RRHTRSKRDWSSDVCSSDLFDILYLLASNPGRVFSTDEIFENVWNEKVYEANNTVMVHIRRLRGKMKEDTRQNKIITTVWGVGRSEERRVGKVGGGRGWRAE